MPFWRTHIIAFEMYVESFGMDPEYINPIGSILPDLIQDRKTRRNNGKFYAHDVRHLRSLLRYIGSVNGKRDNREIAIGMAHHALTDHLFHEGPFFTDTGSATDSVRRIIKENRNGRLTVHKFLEASMERAVRELDSGVGGRAHRGFRNTDFDEISHHLGRCFPHNSYSGERLAKSVGSMLSSEDPLKGINGADGVVYQVLRQVGISDPHHTYAYMDSLSDDASSAMMSEFSYDLHHVLG